MRREPYTLGDHLRAVRASVEAFEASHEGKLPGSLDELQTATAAPPLPPDAWGTALRSC